MRERRGHDPTPRSNYHRPTLGVIQAAIAGRKLR